MHHTKLLPLVLLGLVLAGCASTSPPSEFYTLVPMTRPAPVTARLSTVAIALGPARLPEYLDRPQIVTRSDAVRLHLDEFQRWGGSLREEFLRTLSQDLALQLGSQRVILYPNDERIPLDYRITMDILRLDGQVGRQTTLLVRWIVLDGETGEALSFRQSAIDTPVSTQGYEGIVRANSEAVAALSGEMAQEITRLHDTDRAR